MYRQKKYFILITIIIVLLSQAQSIQTLHQSLLGISLSGNWTTQAKGAKIFPLKNFNYTQYQTVNKTQKDDKFSFKNDTKNNNKTDNGHWINFFTNESGLVQCEIYELPISIQAKTVNVLFLYARLYQNKYLKDRIIEFRVALNSSDDSSKNIKIDEQDPNKSVKPKQYTTARLYENQTLLIIFDLQLQINFQQATDIQHQNSDFWRIVLKSDSIKVQLNVKREEYPTNLLVVLSIVNVIQLLCIIFARKDRRTLYGTSQWLIIHLMLSLLLQAFLYVRASLQKIDTQLKFLIVNSLINTILMFLILKKYQKVFQKFKNRQILFRMLFVLTIYTILAIFFYRQPKFWIIDSMLLLWQIIHSTINGGSVGAGFELITVVILNRIPILIILFNGSLLFKVDPKPSAGIIIILILIFHILVILIQKKFGSRILIPNIFIPDYHKYLRTQYIGTLFAAQQCSICLNRLNQSPDQSSQQKQNQQNHKQNDETSSQNIQINKYKTIEYALTPCNHHYHKKCLQDWLQTNLVCPMCKREVPPLSQN